jgi:hypothetical protein
MQVGAPPSVATSPAIKETHRYCVDWLTSIDGYRCIGEVTAAQQARRDSTWDFVYEGSRLVRLEHLNGRGFLIDDKQICASWQPFWQSTVLKDAICRDRNGIVRRRIHYLKSGAEVRWTDYLGRPADDPRGHALGRLRRFDEAGRLVGWLAVDERGNPSRASEFGVAETRLKRNANGIVVEQSFHDIGGQRLRNHAGVHRYVYEVDAEGKLLSLRFFDETGKPIANHDGVHLIRHAYDDAGNIVRTEWYGVDERPTLMAEEGAAAVDIVRDDHGAEIERRLFDERGNLALGASHYAVQRIAVDAKGFPIEWTHFGVDGSTIRRVEGHFRRKDVRNAHGYTVLSEAFDIDGQPVTSLLGAARIVTEYNARDNVTRMTTTLPSGEPVETTAGYAVAEYGYDGDRIIGTRFLNAKQGRTNSADGHCETHFIYGPAGAMVRRVHLSLWPTKPSHPWRNTADLPQLNYEPQKMGQTSAVPVSADLVHEALAAVSALGASRLFAAAMSAYTLKQLEDAAFLYYAALLRTQADLARFVPKDKGPDSPAVYDRALATFLSPIEYAMGTRPEALARVLERMRGLRLLSDKTYRPEWEVAEESAPTKWQKAITLSQARQLRALEAELGHLRDRAYLACRRVVAHKNLDADHAISDERFGRAIEVVEQALTRTQGSTRSTISESVCTDQDLDPDWIPPLVYSPTRILWDAPLAIDNP